MVQTFIMLYIIVAFVVGLLTGRTWAWGLVFLGVLAFFIKPILWVLLVVLGFGLFILAIVGLERLLDGRRDIERARPLPNVNDLPDYRDPNAPGARKPAKRKSGGVRFYRPVRHFRYTRYSRTMAGVNALARAVARKPPKPKVGDIREEYGKTYRFSESRRWVRVK